MTKLSRNELRKLKTIKWMGKTFKYGRENKKCGNAWSPRWLLIFSDDSEIEFMATSDKIALLMAFQKITNKNIQSY